MVRRVYFPREVPVLSAVVSSCARLLDRAGAVLRRRTVPRSAVAWTWLLAPFLFVLLAILAVSVALPFAALNVYYRDFRFALPFGIQLWLFASPVAYPLSVGARAVAGALRRAEPGGRDPGRLLERARPGDACPTWPCSASASLGTAVVGLARLPPVQAARAQLRGRDLSDDSGGQLRTGQQAVPARRDEGPRYASLRHDLSSIGKRARARLHGRGAHEHGTLALEDVTLRGGRRGELRADRPERRGQEHGAEADLRASRRRPRERSAFAAGSRR